MASDADDAADAGIRRRHAVAARPPERLCLVERCGAPDHAAARLATRWAQARRQRRVGSLLRPSATRLILSSRRQASLRTDPLTNLPTFRAARPSTPTA